MSLFRRWQEPSCRACRPADVGRHLDGRITGTRRVSVPRQRVRPRGDWEPHARPRHAGLGSRRGSGPPLQPENRARGQVAPGGIRSLRGCLRLPGGPGCPRGSWTRSVEAAARARGLAPGLSVTTYLLDGATIGAILREGRGDALIVVGRGRRSSRFPPFSRSVSWQVARRAGSPVAIVDLSDGAARGSSVGRVIVGVHDGSDPTTAVTVAFRAAQRRGVGVTVLMAWGAVEDAVRRCHDAFPDVDLRQLRVEARVGRALIAESPGAALVVFGTPAPGRLHRIRPGSLGRDVVRAARTPVVLVRPGRV